MKLKLFESLITSFLKYRNAVLCKITADHIFGIIVEQTDGSA
jgi:hypothetical protein